MTVDTVNNSAVFQLGAEPAYRRWRSSKLAALERNQPQSPIVIEDPARLSEPERQRLRSQIAVHNFALYQCRDPAATSKDSIRRLGRQLGLTRLDGNLCADQDRITSLRVRGDGAHGNYIPYSNRALSWHTDGYYNAPGDTVRGFILHCARPAACGGENLLLDPELVYMQLRDIDPALVAALMNDDAMTIPANHSDGSEVRPARTGPVFSVDPGDGTLHMRYSARQRNIVWRQDGTTLRARDLITAFLSDPSRAVRHRLQAGQGVITNNVLHARSRFSDSTDAGAGRLLFRARYHQRIDVGTTACARAA